MNDFTPLVIQDGLILDLIKNVHPARVYGQRDKVLVLPDGATYFGIVTEGKSLLIQRPDFFFLREGMFFVTTGATILSTQEELSDPDMSQPQRQEQGAVFVIGIPHYGGLRQVGGPIEICGRLTYINGCSDTLLVSPPRQGEPCLNHLHIPPHTAQSAHTHPSPRIGVILRGRGECRTPHGVHILHQGMGWYIPAECQHSFFTDEESLDVIAWHPDSDFGPTDDDHPMKNKTFIV